MTARNAAQLPRCHETPRDGTNGRLILTCAVETCQATQDGEPLAHNPEVAGSNPVPATSANDPSGATSGVIFMPFVNGFVNVSTEGMSEAVANDMAGNRLGTFDGSRKLLRIDACRSTSRCGAGAR